LLSKAPPQIIVRIGWLLVILLTVFFSGLGALHWIERRGWHAIVEDETEKHGRLLDVLIAQKNKPLRLFAESYARRTSFTRPLDNARSTPPERTLLAGLRTFELQAAWVLEADGSVRLKVGIDEGVIAGPPPLNPAQIAALTENVVAFYMERDGVLYRVRGARLSADATHPGQPRGWLFAALRWENGGLFSPRRSLDGWVSLRAPADASQPVTEENPVRVERLLYDFEKRPIRLLRFDYRPSALDSAESSDWLEVLVMAAVGLVMLGVLAICLVRWVLNPAGALRASLEQRNPSPLEPLLATGGYVGEFAQLVRQAMENQSQLQRTLDDRARLGRELHDGVIQTIYAAGMALASARATLRDNPANAEQVLDDTRAELNATIVDLRAFLKGLESTPPMRRKFSEAVQSMTSLMESARSLRFVLQIDDTVAGRLSAAEQMQLLQIVREATSNASRHSGASLVTVRLHTKAAAVVLEISDNGSGFDPANAADAGSGLANFQARARELGGVISVSRNNGGGTNVRLERPPLPQP
jgi:signal transduction histidine kinase